PDPGPAVSLAPTSGATSAPNLPPVLTQPQPNQPMPNQPSLNPPPAAGAPPSLAPGQGVLALSARYGKDMPAINGGLVWRIFADHPDETGSFKMIREDRGATPNVVRPPGNYAVHV